jgi:hypothetical protein
MSPGAPPVLLHGAAASRGGGTDGDSDAVDHLLADHQPRVAGMRVELRERDQHGCSADWSSLRLAPGRGEAGRRTGSTQCAVYPRHGPAPVFPFDDPTPKACRKRSGTPQQWTARRSYPYSAERSPTSRSPRAGGSGRDSNPGATYSRCLSRGLRARIMDIRGRASRRRPQILRPLGGGTNKVLTSPLRRPPSPGQSVRGIKRELR